MIVRLRTDTAPELLDLERYDAMIVDASSKGWTNGAGTLAHVEHTGS